MIKNYHRTTCVVAAPGTTGKKVTEQVCNFLTVRGDIVQVASYDSSLKNQFAYLDKRKIDPIPGAVPGAVPGYKLAIPSLTLGVSVDIEKFYRLMDEINIAKIKDADLIIQVMIDGQTDMYSTRLMEEAEARNHLTASQIWHFHYIETPWNENKGHGRECVFDKVEPIFVKSDDPDQYGIIPDSGSGGYKYDFLY